jgi:hypothetical protein
MIDYKAARPCTCVRRRPRRVKTAVMAGCNPARICDQSQGLVMRNTRTFLFRFAAAWGSIAAVWAPILIYVAWVTW